MALSKSDIMLICAAEAGNIVDVKKALKNGADIHVADDDALRLAARSGYKEIVELLLVHGADTHARGYKALQMAAASGHMQTVALLLDYGVDIHAANYALYLAAFCNHKKTAVVLLRHGADPLAKDNGGKDLFNDTQLAQWLDELKSKGSEHFKSGKSLRKLCFSTGKLHDKVLDTCITSQFTTFIGAPLVASTDQSDRQLFQDIWEALPSHWQEQNQNIYMQFIKEGGINPVIGQHSSLARCGTETPDGGMGR